MIVLTDIDGCVLDWEEGFTVWMDHRGHTQVPGYKEHYGIDTRYGMEKSVSKKLVEQFNSSAAIGFLPPLRDAQYYIKLLHEKLQVKFVAVTSLSDDPYAKKLRERNLAKLFGDNTFEEVICLPCGADKDDILEELKAKYADSIWIEDKTTNARVGAALGYETLLIEHKYNMHDQGDFTLVKGWETIYNYIEVNYERLCTGAV